LHVKAREPSKSPGQRNHTNVTDDGHPRVHIERVTNNGSSQWSTRANVQQDLPREHDHEDGHAMAAFGNQYMITWLQRPAAHMGAEVVLEMGTKKEQWLWTCDPSIGAV
jgi:hypothetical protein